MFLKEITVNNYRSIQNAKVRFHDGLNILIGKNGAGKSNLLKYINQNVSYNSLGLRSKVFRNANLDIEYTVSSVEDAKIFELTVYLKRDKIAINNEIEYNKEIKLSKKNGNKYIYENEIIEIPALNFSKKKNEYVNEYTHDLELLKKLRKLYISFDIPKDSFWLGSAAKYNIDNELNINNEESFFNGFSIFLDLENLIEFAFISEVKYSESKQVEEIPLEFIKKIFIDSFEKLKSKYNIDECLSKFSPISDLRLNPNVNLYYAENNILVENLLIDFKVNETWIPWSYLSDGTKRLFYLITQCLSRENGILLIEEPELGIHPHQLFSLMQFIKDQSDSKQIIISTHSPIVLDILSSDELDRITIVKLLPNGTNFSNLTKPQIKKAKEYIDKVGELSYYWLHSDLEK